MTNPMMHRTKILAAALALVVTASAATVLLGGASAASWHVYEGDIHAGHAYGLQVPADAASYEIAFAGEAGSARVAVYDPAGDKLGLYDLGPAMTTAAILQPAAGRHAIYVYELAEGALTVRVNAEEAPALSLQKLPLAREDVEIGAGDGAAFAKSMTLTLKQAPVFLTLLYEGSAANLDATVASEKGPVVTITDETATAFSPGVWSSMTGQRASDATNIEGLTYTVTVDAERFEGTLVLTTLALDLSAPAKAPAPQFKPTPPEAPEAPEAPDAPDAGVSAPATAILVEEGVAMEFTAVAGKLLVFDPSQLEQPEEGDENASHRGHHDYTRFAVSIYTPEDALLAFVHVDDHANATEVVELPTDGAYVAYVHYASDDAVALQLAEGEIAEARQIQVVEETYAFHVDGWSESEVSFDLARAPIALHMRYAEDSFGALDSAELSNERGVVASLHTLAHAPYVHLYGWSEVHPENFDAGTHVLRAHSFVPTNVEIHALSYVREPLAVEEPVEPAPAEEPSDEEPSEEPSNEEPSDEGDIWDILPW